MFYPLKIGGSYDICTNHKKSSKHHVKFPVRRLWFTNVELEAKFKMIICWRYQKKNLFSIVHQDYFKVK